jgi:hypothetical protein
MKPVSDLLFVAAIFGIFLACAAFAAALERL